MADNNEQYQAENTAFKHEDTTNMMKISFIGGNGYPIYPVKSHKFIAKVATADGAYVGDYPCSAVDNRFQIKSADLKGLSSGRYKLEIWETYTDDDGKDQTGIFPSPSAFVGFTINKNIEDTVWDLVKEISFQDIVDKAVISSGQHLVVAATNTLASDLPASVTQEFKDGKNQLTFNIPRGVKGDKGDRGVQGIQGVKGDTGDRGPDGKQGPKGDPGKPFSIAKVFPSKDTMNGDGLSEGDFVMIASNVNDPNNATLFTWTGSEFKEIADLSGAQGIQGPQGPQGEQGPKGDPGERGPEGQQGVQGKNGNDGHTPVRGVDYWTDADKQSIYDETKQYVEDAILNGKW